MRAGRVRGPLAAGPPHRDPPVRAARRLRGRRRGGRDADPAEAVARPPGRGGGGEAGGLDDVGTGPDAAPAVPGDVPPMGILRCKPL